MMKRYIALLLALVTILSVSSAWAIPTPKPAATAAPSAEAAVFTTPTAPSYGVFKGQEDAAISVLPDGTASYLYQNVSQEEYEAFGAWLEETYAVAEDTVVLEGNKVSFDMVNPQIGISFTLAFDGSMNRLTMTYPAGTIVETIPINNPFASYVEVVPGQTVRGSACDITIDEVHLFDGEQFSSKMYSTYYYDCWLGGSVYNKSTGTLNYDSLKFSLHYINADAAYRYDSERTCGGFTQLKGNMVTYTYKDAHNSTSLSSLSLRSGFYLNPQNAKLSSLDSSLYISYFDGVPRTLAQAKDGILAVTFNVDGVDYVLYLRH